MSVEIFETITDGSTLVTGDVVLFTIGKVERRGVLRDPVTEVSQFCAYDDAGYGWIVMYFDRSLPWYISDLRRLVVDDADFFEEV